VLYIRVIVQYNIKNTLHSSLAVTDFWRRGQDIKHVIEEYLYSDDDEYWVATAVSQVIKCLYSVHRTFTSILLSRSLSLAVGLL